MRAEELAAMGAGSAGFANIGDRFVRVVCGRA
jgi:hypothetical protein